MGNGGIAAASFASVLGSRPAAIPRERKPWNSFDRRLPGPQSRAGLDAVEQRKIMFPCRPTCSPEYWVLRIDVCIVHV
jgi:hypothetical protein